MPNRVKRNSVVDMLAKVPVHRGSLLKSIENLLKTIESSESAVMIPTLLRDKCEFDAWELLFVAKILKASILGHTDLVEFYMNHMGHTTNQFKQQASVDQQQLTSSGRQSSPTSSVVQENNTNGSSNSASPVTVIATNGTSQSAKAAAPTFQPISSSSSSWATATSGGPSISSSSSLNSYNGNNAGAQDSPPAYQENQPEQLEQSLLAAARPVLMRQALPPTLLQLTTTNNHINSVASFTSNNIEQLTNQLTAMQVNNNNISSPTGSTSNGVEGALSISTVVAEQSTTTATTPTSNAATREAHPHELRTSRSAGCLFRLNSGASSPRTPSTPYPQAETLASGLANNISGDPSAPVKLLLQIEQLKSSISHVTHLLESVVELYKKSIDNIAMA